MSPEQTKPSETPFADRISRASSSRRWLRVSVSLAVALAFADASIVVLALPQIVDRLHTSISHVVWVIASYNLALIVGALAIIPMAGRLSSRRALVAGLAVFGLASLGSGAAGTMGVLVGMRAVQGLGGALLLCASLPVFAVATRSGESPLAGWATAAALGAAIGPAVGGLLTEVFDWRAIFLAQAPVAAAAALAVLAAHRPQPAAHTAQPSTPAPEQPVDPGPGAERESTGLKPVTANLALLFMSAGLIGALFLVTILLINGWGATPLGAAAVLSAIPLGTWLAERLTRGRSPVVLGAAGALTLAAGLTGLALVSHRQLGWVLVALAVCGVGLGMAFPALTSDALRSSGTLVARAAKTVAARDAGLVLGLLILTPVFVNELQATSDRAVPSVAAEVIVAPIPGDLKTQLAAGLLAANAKAPPSRLPDIGPPFAQVEATASAPVKAQLALLEARVEAVIDRAATHSFRRPLLYCAAFALLVIPLLGLGLILLPRPDTDQPPGPSREGPGALTR
jgi:predicted MFS family arabinose efflux permease